MKEQLLAFLFLPIFWTCAHYEKKGPTLNPAFRVPSIVQTPPGDSIIFETADHLEDVWFEVYGKYAFVDSIYVEASPKRDTTYLNDILREYSGPRADDSLATDGFQIFADFNTTIYQQHFTMSPIKYFFPLYVVNETSRTKVFLGKDSYAFGLQEVMAWPRSGVWRPIECHGFDFCGNGYYGLKVHPGEFVMLLVPKYAGDTKGAMRVRLKIGETLYFSPAYEGTFNSSQLLVKEGTWPYGFLKKDNVSTIRWMFFWAIPKGYDGLGE